MDNVNGKSCKYIGQKCGNCIQNANLYCNTSFNDTCPALSSWAVALPGLGIWSCRFSTLNSLSLCKWTSVSSLKGEFYLINSFFLSGVQISQIMLLHSLLQYSMSAFCNILLLHYYIIYCWTETKRFYKKLFLLVNGWIYKSYKNAVFMHQISGM